MDPLGRCHVPCELCQKEQRKHLVCVPLREPIGDLEDAYDNDTGAEDLGNHEVVKECCANLRDKLFGLILCYLMLVGMH